jgi:clan AA aspartic protease
MTLKFKPQGELKMGLTHVAVTLGHLNSFKETYTANFLVDTGAMDSMAPAAELRKIGIEPVGKRTYELASGEVLEYEHGIVQMRFLDEIIGTDIIFGPDGTEPLLGVIALESAGFLVDPKSQSLRKLFARPLKKSAKLAIAG